MLEKVRAILADYTNVSQEEIQLETTFSEQLGLSSLDLIDIIVAFEEEFDIEIPEQKLSELITVGDVIETLAVLISEK